MKTVMSGEDGHKALLCGEIWSKDGVDGYRAAQEVDRKERGVQTGPL